ncbi:MAG: flagellar hook-length control protein FliK [Hyphomicrobiales bacterium]|nr:MAG: flagellar hook-length control protein FliK [Hyphomicrobiales bacterium]
MPIQSVFTHQASAEAPAARSRAVQTEAREGGEVFALPEAEAAAAGANKAGAAATGVSGAVEAAKDAVAAEQVIDPAKLRAQVDAAQPAISAVAPAATSVPAGKPAPQTAPADARGIAFLIAMAAAQTGNATEVAGKNPAAESGAVTGELRDGVTKKDDKAAVKGEGEAEAAVAASVVDSQIVVPVPALILPAVVLPLGPLLAADVAAEGAGEAMNAEGGAKKDTAKPALAAATAGLALAAIPSEIPQAEIAGAMEGKVAPGGVHAAGAAGQGMQELADSLAKADQPAATKGTPALADAKALDAQQQPAAPFDLSTLLQQAPGKAGHERLLQPLDPNAAPGTAPGASGQGTTSGPPTPIHVVPIEIGLRAMSGARQFDIRLDPGELGRVDVSLSISDKGEVSARLVVDRVETLHLLQRDARTLERAFEQAGLKPSDGGVDITLRDPSDQSAFRQNRQQDEAPQRPRQPNGSELAEDAPLSIDPAPQRRLIRLGGVDLSI